MPSLEEHLRKVTRQFTNPLAEDAALGMARELLRALVGAHAASPPRYPGLDAAAIVYDAGQATLPETSPNASAVDDLFELGALVNGLVQNRPAEVAWRLDGPPAPQASTILRAAFFATLGSPRPEARFDSAAAALAAVEAAIQEPSRPRRTALFRVDPARSGVASPDPARGASRVWATLLGPVAAAPVVTEELVLAATADGRLVFLDRATGRLLHETKLGSAVESSPALSNGRLFVGTDDGELLAVDAHTGALLFRAKLGQLIRSAPLPLDDRVIVGVVDAKSGGLIALDAVSGKPVWKAKLGPVFSSPALAGERVIVGSDDGSVHAFDKQTGALAWSHALGSKVRATPVVTGDAVIVADFAGRVAALSVADGTQRWKRETPAAIYSSPCVAQGLAVTANNDGVVHATDAASGAPGFELITRGPVVASVSALGTTFVVASTDGSLYLIDAQGGLTARLDAQSGAIQATPAFDGAELFLGAERGVVAMRIDR